MPKNKDVIQPIEANFDDVVAKMVAPQRNLRNEPLRALYSGTFRSVLDFDVDCYVLNDKDKTAVISQQGIQWLFDEKTISTYIGQDVIEKLKNPISFHNELGVVVLGYNAEVLADVCLSIISPMKSNRDSVALQRAFSILRFAAKIGIAEVVYQACKYKKTLK